MRFKNHCLGYWLACGISPLIAMSYGEAAFAAPATGTAPASLSHVFAVLQTGQPDPNSDDTAACTMQMTTPDSRYLGLLVTTRYWIDAKSQIMNVSSSLPSPHATQRLGYTIELSPLGLANQYAFGAFRPAALPDTYVLFSMSPDFKAAISVVLVLNPGKHYNCLVTNSQTPFDGGLSAAFATHQK